MDTVKALEERRSINFFDPGRYLGRDEIERVLSLANLSPSSSNLQPWEVVVVDDPERKRVLRECAFSQAKVEEASAVLIIAANPGAIEQNFDAVFRRSVELGYRKEEEAAAAKAGVIAFQGAPDSERRRLFAVKNASLFAMSVMVAAKGLGIETHPMDGFKEDKVKKEFHLPQDWSIPMLIAMGYLLPGAMVLPRAHRRELSAFVRYNNFNQDNGHA